MHCIILSLTFECQIELNLSHANQHLGIYSFCDLVNMPKPSINTVSQEPQVYICNLEKTH